MAGFVEDGLDAFHLSGGLAHNIALKGLCLVVPLSDGVAVGYHAVVIAQLHLGLEGLGSVNGTAGDVHLALGNVQTAGDNLAVLVGDDCGHGGVYLGIVFLGGIGAEVNAHAQFILAAGRTAGGKAEHHACEKKKSNKFFHDLLL